MMTQMAHLHVSVCSTMATYLLFLHDPVCDKMSSIAPTTAHETSTSALAGELAVASDKDSSMPSSEMQSFLDR